MTHAALAGVGGGAAELGLGDLVLGPGRGGLALLQRRGRGVIVISEDFEYFLSCGLEGRVRGLQVRSFRDRRPNPNRLQALTGNLWSPLLCL